MAGRRAAYAGAILVVLVLRTARAEVTVPDPGTFVVDRADIIDAGVERRLEGWLVELAAKTGSQVKVLTVTTTEGEDWFGFVQRHADLWKLGRKGKDDGVLIAVKPKSGPEKGEIRIHPGYGLEGALPDSWCGSLSRAIVDKYLRAGRYSDGIYDLTIRVANRVADEAKVTLAGIPDYRYQVGRPRGVICGGGLVPLVIMFIVFSSMSRRNRHRRSWGGGGLLHGLLWAGIFGSMMGGGRRSSWGSFGGFGGGGFGGGSFGGGGGFGGAGGGASW